MSYWKAFPGEVVAEEGKGETTEHFTTDPPGTQGTDFLTKAVFLSPTPKSTICSLGYGSAPSTPVFRSYSSIFLTPSISKESLPNIHPQTHFLREC